MCASDLFGPHLEDEQRSARPLRRGGAVAIPIIPRRGVGSAIADAFFMFRHCKVAFPPLCRVHHDSFTVYDEDGVIKFLFHNRFRVS